MQSPQQEQKQDQMKKQQQEGIGKHRPSSNKEGVGGTDDRINNKIVI
jgi:hypothetical protein